MSLFASLPPASSSGAGGKKGASEELGNVLPSEAAGSKGKPEILGQLAPRSKRRKRSADAFGSASSSSSGTAANASTSTLFAPRAVKKSRPASLLFAPRSTVIAKTVPAKKSIISGGPTLSALTTSTERQDSQLSTKIGNSTTATSHLENKTSASWNKVIIDRSSVDDTFTVCGEGKEYDPLIPNDFDSQEEEVRRLEKMKQDKAKLKLQLEQREAREREQRRRQQATAATSFLPRGLNSSTEREVGADAGRGRGRGRTLPAWMTG